MRTILFFLLFSTVCSAQIKSPDHKSSIGFLSARIGYGYSPIAIKPGGLFFCTDGGIIFKNKFGIASSVQYRIGKIIGGLDNREIKKSRATELGLTRTFVINNRSVMDAFLQFGVGQYILEHSLYGSSTLRKSLQIYYLNVSPAIQYAKGFRNLELSTGVRVNLPIQKTEPEATYLLFYIGVGYRGMGKR